MTQRIVQPFAKNVFLTLLCMIAVSGFFYGIPSASAEDNGPSQIGEICMQKIFGTPVSNSNLLNCTANDIRLSKAISVSPSSCTKGTHFDLTATFETVVTANARYDAGFFFRVDGGANARGDGTNASGQCSLSKLTIPPPPNPPVLELDGDTCGDLNSGVYNITFTIPNVLCQDTNNDNLLNLPNCTSWHSNQSTSCAIESAFDFDPDTKSKCVCDDTFQVPVTVEDATLTVIKSASPIQVPEPGGTVTFSVSITNDASIESVNITTIVDDVYGDLGDNTNSLISDNTCLLLIGEELSPGESANCSFKALVEGDAGDRVTDTVEACAYQPGNGGSVCDDDPADVDITDVWDEPTLEKTAQSVANCRMDATYQVVVSNNSEFDDLNVTALNDDKFGDISVVHAAGGGFAEVVSTDCVLPQVIDPSGNFSCNFVGRIVSSNCDFSHTNKVTATATDDDGITSYPYDDATVSQDATP